MIRPMFRAGILPVLLIGLVPMQASAQSLSLSLQAALCLLYTYDAADDYLTV